jgi:predicted phosphate transport protein (TIGR00153 family)
MGSPQRLARHDSSARSRLQSFLRVFLPRDDRFFDWLESQARIGSLAAHRLDELTSENLAEVIDDLNDYEHQGDAVLDRLEREMAKTFITPLDREDIQRLASELDKVLNYYKRSANSLALRNIDGPTPLMKEMTAIIRTTADLLLEAVLELRRHRFNQVLEVSRQVRELESAGDRLHQTAIAELYRRPGINPLRLRGEEKTIENLEKALNHAERLADTLIYLAVKHG